MALPTINGTGSLLGDPKTGQTSSGGTWTSAVLKFAKWTKQDGEWTETDPVIIAAIAFDDTATELAGFAKGDPIEIRATINSVSLWQGKPQLKATIDACRVPVKEAKKRTQPHPRRQEDPRWPAAAIPGQATPDGRPRLTAVRGGQPQRAVLERLDRQHRHGGGSVA